MDLDRIGQVDLETGLIVASVLIALAVEAVGILGALEIPESLEVLDFEILVLLALAVLIGQVALEIPALLVGIVVAHLATVGILDR